LNGCWDGGLEYVDKVLDWAYSNGLSVLLDVHAMKDSQNGFDNSGQSLGFSWTTQIGYEYAPAISFAHWYVLIQIKSKPIQYNIVSLQYRHRIVIAIVVISTKIILYLNYNYSI